MDTGDRCAPEAITVSGSQAVVSFLAEPCAPESHVATIELRRDPAGWILQRKRVKLPK